MQDTPLWIDPGRESQGDDDGLHVQGWGARVGRLWLHSFDGRKEDGPVGSLVIGDVYVSIVSTRQARDIFCVRLARGRLEVLALVVFSLGRRVSSWCSVLTHRLTDGSAGLKYFILK